MNNLKCGDSIVQTLTEYGEPIYDRHQGLVKWLVLFHMIRLGILYQSSIFNITTFKMNWILQIH